MQFLTTNSGFLCGLHRKCSSMLQRLRDNAGEPKMTSSFTSARGRCAQFSMTKFERAIMVPNQCSIVTLFLSFIISKIMRFSYKPKITSW